MTVEVDIDLRTTVFVVVGLRIGNLVTGDDDAALDVGYTAFAAAEREGLGGRARRVRLGGQTKLQVGGLAQYALGLGGVLHARQLDHNAVGALTLHQRLGHTQFVDPVTHRGQVLRHRVITNAGNFRLGQRQLQDVLLLTLGGFQRKLIVLPRDQAARFAALLFIGKAKLQGVALGWQAAITQAFGTHQAANLALVDIDPRLDGLIHVHLQQKVHATGQVQTQRHRASADIAQPLRRGRRQVLRHHVIAPQRVAHNILRLQLIGAIDQTHQARAAVGAKLGALGRQVGGGQRLFNAVEIGLLDFQRGAGTGNLNGRIIRIQVGHCVDQAQCEHGHDQQVFPEGVTIEHIRA